MRIRLGVNSHQGLAGVGMLAALLLVGLGVGAAKGRATDQSAAKTFDIGFSQDFENDTASKVE